MKNYILDADHIFYPIDNLNIIAFDKARLVPKGTIVKVFPGISMYKLYTQLGEQAFYSVLGKDSLNKLKYVGKYKIL